MGVLSCSFVLLWLWHGIPKSFAVVNLMILGVGCNRIPNLMLSRFKDYADELCKEGKHVSIIEQTCHLSKQWQSTDLLCLKTN